MALTYGMSVKEFWEDDPNLFWAYRFSYYERIKNEQETFNYNAWLQGIYFYNAISIALSNGFGKSHYKYPDKPFGVELQKSKENSKETQAEIQSANIRARVKQVQEIMNKNSGTTKRENKPDR